MYQVQNFALGPKVGILSSPQASPIPLQGIIVTKKTAISQHVYIILNLQLHRNGVSICNVDANCCIMMCACLVRGPKVSKVCWVHRLDEVLVLRCSTEVKIRTWSTIWFQSRWRKLQTTFQASWLVAYNTNSNFIPAATLQICNGLMPGGWLLYPASMWIPPLGGVGFPK